MGRKTWRECVKCVMDGTDELGLHPEWGMIQGYVEGPHIGTNVQPKLSVEEI